MVGKDTSTIEITAPTVANQNITIRDYGPGLSLEDVKNIFAKIAVSNKDHSDLFNGGFGIGSKSWFAVNTSFYVISTYNKEKTYYTVSFDESKGIFISVDHKEKTKEKNGVEIQLPLANKKQIKDSHKAIIRAVEYWDKHPKLINCDIKPTKPIFKEKEYTLLSHNHDGYDPKVIVTLGGTPYSIKEMPSIYEINNKMSYFNVAIHFEVGEMNLNNTQEVGPDREAFAAACDKIIFNKVKKVHKQIVDKMEKELDKLKTREEICEFIANPELSKRFKNTGYKRTVNDSTFVVFTPNDYSHDPEKVNVKIQGENPDYVNVNGNASQAESFLNRVKAVSHLYLQDVELKDYELRAAIAASLPSIARPSKYCRVDTAAYVYNSDYFTDKDVKELKKYFEVTKVSEIKYSVQKRASKKTPLDTLNIMKCNWRDTYASNIKIKLEELPEDFEYVSNQTFEKAKNCSWETVRDAHKILNRNIATVSKTNADKLKDLGYEETSLSKLVKEVKAEENAIYERRKQEAVDNGLVEYYAQWDFIRYIENQVCGWNNGFDSFFNNLKKMKITNPKIKKLLNIDFPDVDELHQMKYEYSDVLDELKIKQDKTYIKFFKTVEKQRPGLFFLLMEYHDEKDYWKEIALLFKGVK